MLKERIASLKEALAQVNALEPELNQREDKQISLTDPEARSLRTRGTGIVGSNVQTVVEPKNHSIVSQRELMTCPRPNFSKLAIALRLASARDKPFKSPK